MTCLHIGLERVGTGDFIYSEELKAPRSVWPEWRSETLPESICQ